MTAHRPFALVLLAIAPLFAAAPATAEWMSREEPIMGTAVRVELFAKDRAAGESAMQAVIDEMNRIDRVMSPYKPESELSAINRDAPRRQMRISQEMFDLIKRSIEFSKMSDGAFDITFSSVGYLYDYRKGKKPTDDEIIEALPGINYRHLVLDPVARTIRFASWGVRIDLGGIAKGYAVDRCIAILKARGVKEALVSAGGDSRVLGDKHGKPWMIGIRDPRNKDGLVAVIPLKDAAISTSGDYERYFERDGVRHHHIINPKTGKSAWGVRSVTVVGPDSITNEGLTKSVFIMGPERGLKLIESMAGIDAVVVDDQGRIFYSKGFENRSASTKAVRK
jgi:thiamine biosynthesis lipoprotein